MAEKVIIDEPGKRGVVTGEERFKPGKCEESKEGHLVKVRMWPPKQRYSATKRTPSISGECVHCGAHVIVYDPVQPGLTVLLPSGKKMTGVGETESKAG